MDFSNRSYRKELIDFPDIPPKDIERNMLELDRINTWLGGHAVSLKGLKTLLRRGISAKSATAPRDSRPLTVCEIGCGGGDNLAAIGRYCAGRRIPVRLIGVDSNPDCIAVARARSWTQSTEWIIADYRQAGFDGGKVDIIFSSLFCHHFTDAELVYQLSWMEKHAETGWFINDLHRHPLAWYSIRLLTRCFSRSYLVRNDAPLSVQRGFTRQEWEKLLKQAGITAWSIRWKWAFRWLITVRKAALE